VKTIKIEQIDKKLNCINIKHSNVIRASCVVLAIIISLLMIRFFKAPYIYVGLLWFAMTLFLSLTSSSSSIKALWFNLGAVVIALTIFEAYLWLKNGEFYITERVSNRQYFSTPNDFLGYTPRVSTMITASEYYKDDLIYDVTYRIDENGLRIGPPYNKSNLVGCTLFFVDSYTFGLGVNDNETLPYQVGIKSGGRYRIYNFAYRGYGPHQMLSALEHNLVERIVNCDGPKFAVYQAIPDHINRSAGLTDWDYNGPKYVLGKNGEVMFAGNFYAGKIITRTITKHLNKSIIYRAVIGNRRFSEEDRDRDIDLFVGIVLASKRDFEKLYPSGKFHVIFWDNWFDKDEKPEKVSGWLRALKSLKDKGVAVHLTNEIIPDYRKNRSKYILSPYDGHPNALTNQILAEYVVHNILPK
jgi:hypothetical protein